MSIEGDTPCKQLHVGASFSEGATSALAIKRPLALPNHLEMTFILFTFGESLVLSEAVKSAC